jgi:hypothetical protein
VENRVRNLRSGMDGRMDNSSKALIILIVATLLASCTSANIPTAAPSDTLTPVVTPSLSASAAQITPVTTPTSSATLRPSPTNQPLVIPVTISPTPSEPQIKKHRVTIETMPSTNADMTGTLVLEVNGYLGYLLDLQTLDKSLLPVLASGQPWLGAGMDGSCQTVSPNRRWLAYIERFKEKSGKQLRIIGTDRQQLSIIQPEGWEHIISWLDNERLALTSREHPDGTVIVFNPFTSETQEIAPSFTPISPSKLDGWYAVNSPLVLYDPSLARVFFEQLKQTQPNINFKDILWDSTSKQVLWETSSVAGYRPSWSSDGEYLAVSFGLDEQGTFILDRDGHEIQYLQYIDGAPAWLPQSWRIAGHWTHSETCGSDLYAGPAIYDTASGTIDIYCVGSINYLPLPPVWSPDGRWIAINDEFQDAFRVILIDLVEDKAYEVARDATVVGWMVKP